MKTWKKLLISSSALGAVGITSACAALGIINSHNKKQQEYTNVHNLLVNESNFSSSNSSVKSVNSYETDNYLNSNIDFYSFYSNGLTAKILFNTTTMKLQMAPNALVKNQKDLPNAFDWTNQVLQWMGGYSGQKKGAVISLINPLKGTSQQYTIGYFNRTYTSDIANVIKNWTFNYGDIIKLQTSHNHESFTNKLYSQNRGVWNYEFSYNGVLINNNGKLIKLGDQRSNFMDEPSYFKITKDGLVPWTPLTLLNNLGQISSTNQKEVTVSGTSLPNSDVEITLGNKNSEKFYTTTNSIGNFSIDIKSNNLITVNTNVSVWVYNPLTKEGTLPIETHFFAKQKIAKSGIFLSYGSNNIGSIYFNPLSKKIVFQHNFLNINNYFPNFTRSTNTQWFNNEENMSGQNYLNELKNKEDQSKKPIVTMSGLYDIPNKAPVFYLSISLYNKDKKLMHEAKIIANQTTMKTFANELNNWSFDYGDKIVMYLNNSNFLNTGSVNGVNNYNNNIWLEDNYTPNYNNGYYYYETTISENGLIKASSQSLQTLCATMGGIDYSKGPIYENMTPANGINNPNVMWNPINSTNQQWEDTYQGIETGKSNNKNKSYPSLAFTVDDGSITDPETFFATNENFVTTVNNLKNEAIKTKTPGESDDWAIAKYFQEWVTKNMKYSAGGEVDGKTINISDNEGANGYNLMDIFEQKKGVCWDYAILYASMCAQVGIVAAVIDGSIANIFSQDMYDGFIGLHSYNMIYMPSEKRWIYVDPTWNFFNGGIYINTTRENMYLAAVVWNTSKKYSSYFSSNPIMQSYHLGIYWNQQIFDILPMTEQQIQAQLKEMDSIQ